MEPANEETGLVPRPTPLPSSHPSSSGHVTTVAASNSQVLGISTDQKKDTSALQTDTANGSSKDRPVSGIVPPYWSHARKASRASQTSLDPSPAITLEDHTEDPNSETSRGLWAKSVSVNDHVVVQGKTGIGAYVVWNCTIQTLEVRGIS